MTLEYHRWNSTFKVGGSVLNKISKRKQNSEVRLGSKNIKPPKLQGKRVASLRRSRLNAVGRRGKQESGPLARWRRECRERDNYTCQYPGCGRYNKQIDVHHIAKRSQRPDLKLEVSNGVCLCRAHHRWTDLNHDEAVKLGLLSTATYELAKKQEREEVAA